MGMSSLISTYFRKNWTYIFAFLMSLIKVIKETEASKDHSRCYRFMTQWQSRRERGLSDRPQQADLPVQHRAAQRSFLPLHLARRVAQLRGHPPQVCAARHTSQSQVTFTRQLLFPGHLPQVAQGPRRRSREEASKSRDIRVSFLFSAADSPSPPRAVVPPPPASSVATIEVSLGVESYVIQIRFHGSGRLKLQTARILKRQPK